MSAIAGPRSRCAISAVRSLLRLGRLRFPLAPDKRPYIGHAAFSIAFGYHPLMNFLRDESSASSLSVRLSTLTGNELRSLIERLANDGEAIAARIDYLTRPQFAVESNALRIGGNPRADRLATPAVLESN